MRYFSSSHFNSLDRKKTSSLFMAVGLSLLSVIPSATYGSPGDDEEREMRQVSARTSLKEEHEKLAGKLKLLADAIAQDTSGNYTVEEREFSALHTRHVTLVALEQSEEFKNHPDQLLQFYENIKEMGLDSYSEVDDGPIDCYINSTKAKMAKKAAEMNKPSTAEGQLPSSMNLYQTGQFQLPEEKGERYSALIREFPGKEAFIEHMFARNLVWDLHLPLIQKFAEGKITIDDLDAIVKSDNQISKFEEIINQHP